MFKKFIRLIAAVLTALLVFFSPQSSIDKAKLFETCVDGISWLVSYVENLDPSTPTEEDQEIKDSYNYEKGLILQNSPHLTYDPYLTGIDVSSFQGIIDWQAVADSGIDFAIIRTGEGKTIEDERFHYNFQGAKDAGLLVGVYHFSYASTPERAEEEANFVCSLLDGKKLDLPVFYDQEAFYNNKGFSPTVCARSFCEIVEAQGYQAGLYFPAFFGETHYELQELAEYPCWVALWSNGIYQFSYPVACWQYTSSGSIPGIETPVDMNKLWLPQ